MMKRVERIVSLLLILSLFLTNSISFADSDNFIQDLKVGVSVEIGESTIMVLEDNNDKYVVKEIKGNEVTIATNDKLNNELIIEKYDEMNKEETFSREVIDINEYFETVNHLNKNINSRGVISENESEGGYSYLHEYDNKAGGFYWYVKTPKSNTLAFPEHHKDMNDINGFKKAVDNIVKAEAAGEAAVGTSLMTAGVQMLYGNGLAAALALFAGAGVSAKYIYDVDTYSKDADHYFGRLKSY